MYFAKPAAITIAVVLIGVLAITCAIDFKMIATAGEIIHHNNITTAVLATIGVKAERVIRLCELPSFLGVKRSQIAEAIKAGWLHPFTPIPGGRSKCVTEAEVIALQQRAMIEAAKATTTATAEPASLAKAHKRKRGRVPSSLSS
jgi:hypothetical protein